MPSEVTLISVLYWHSLLLVISSHFLITFDLAVTEEKEIGLAVTQRSLSLNRFRNEMSRVLWCQALFCRLPLCVASIIKMTPPEGIAAAPAVHT